MINFRIYKNLSQFHSSVSSSESDWSDSCVTSLMCWNRCFRKPAPSFVREAVPALAPLRTRQATSSEVVVVSPITLPRSVGLSFCRALMIASRFMPPPAVVFALLVVECFTGLGGCVRGLGTGCEGSGGAWRGGGGGGGATCAGGGGGGGAGIFLAISAMA